MEADLHDSWKATENDRPITSDFVTLFTMTPMMAETT